MSTVKAVNFQHPSSTAANLTLAADGTVTGGLPAGGRNLLYNGAMQVAQRGTSTASITSNTFGAADRWRISPSSMGTWTQSVENDAPTGSGFRKSTKILCTTADASPAAGDHVVLVQGLEGQDLQRVAKGTSSAQQLTLSFWVKSNVTGTYIANVYDNDNTRWVSASYTISASATWERKTITFPADTTGAWDNDNEASLYLHMFLGAGSTYTSGTLGTTWRAAAFANGDIAVGQTNLAAATNNYWQITGVQLEVGPVASAFEFKPFGQELRECQRYYQKSYNLGTTVGTVTDVGSLETATQGTFSYHRLPAVVFAEKMRATPTITLYSPVTGTTARIRDSVGNTDRVGDVTKVGEGGFVAYIVNVSIAAGSDIWAHWRAEIEL